MMNGEKFYQESSEGKPEETGGELSKRKKKVTIIRLPNVPALKEFRDPVRVSWVKDRIVLEADSFGDAIAALEQIEKEGIPDLGVSKKPGFINLETRHINGEKVQLRIKGRGGRTYPQMLEDQDINDENKK